MKIKCTCNHTIIDGAEDNPNKFYLIGSSTLNDFWEKIDESLKIVKDHPGREEAQAMKLRRETLFQPVWQCQNCGRLWVNQPDNQLTAYRLD